MSAKNIIIGEIRIVLSRLRMNNRWKSEIMVSDGISIMTIRVLMMRKKKLI